MDSFSLKSLLQTSHASVRKSQGHTYHKSTECDTVRGSSSRQELKPLNVSCSNTFAEV